jgi:hypothetical protein
MGTDHCFLGLGLVKRFPQLPQPGNTLSIPRALHHGNAHGRRRQQECRGQALRCLERYSRADASWSFPHEFVHTKRRDSSGSVQSGPELVDEVHTSLPAFLCPVTADGSSVTVKSADLMVSAAEERAESLTENRLRLHRIPSIDGREPCQRTLIHFPVIHTQADMGELSEPIQRLKLKRLGHLVNKNRKSSLVLLLQEACLP